MGGGGEGQGSNMREEHKVPRLRTPDAYSSCLLKINARKKGVIASTIPLDYL